MKPTDIAVYGISGVAIFGIIYFILNKFTGSGSMLKKIFNKEQEEKQQEIVTINKKQDILQKQFKESEKASIEAKKKIDQIYKNTAKEVNKVLKEDKISVIDSEIDDAWDDL